MPEYRRRFQKKLNNLNKDIEKLGDIVLKNYRSSINLFQDYSDEKYEIISGFTETILNSSEKIENECISLLAMEQPVAKDLRFIETSIKIASHLKRMGKLSQNIADIAYSIKVTAIPSEPLNSMIHMAKEVDSMMTRSFRAFNDKDTEEASELEIDDDVVDDLFDEFLVIVTTAMKKDNSKIDILVPFLLIARYLERLADRSESIGYRIILMQGYLDEDENKKSS